MDPRTTLDDAAQRRLKCQVMPVGGAWVDGMFVRVDKAGVVVVAPGIGLRGGEDVRVWFSMDETSCSFEASVLRAGVPVPDRSQDGLMLGFIDGWKEETGGEGSEGEAEGVANDRDIALTIIPANGRGLELIGGESRLVDISANELTFTLPQGVALKFLEGGQVRLRLRVDGSEVSALGKVARLAPGESHFLYGVRFEEIDESERFIEAVEAVRSLT